MQASLYPAWHPSSHLVPLPSLWPFSLSHHTWAVLTAPPLTHCPLFPPQCCLLRLPCSPPPPCSGGSRQSCWLSLWCSLCVLLWLKEQQVVRVYTGSRWGNANVVCLIIYVCETDTMSWRGCTVCGWVFWGGWGIYHWHRCTGAHMLSR